MYPGLTENGILKEDLYLIICHIGFTTGHFHGTEDLRVYC